MQSSHLIVSHVSWIDCVRLIAQSALVLARQIRTITRSLRQWSQFKANGGIAHRKFLTHRACDSLSV